MTVYYPPKGSMKPERGTMWDNQLREMQRGDGHGVLGLGAGQNTPRAQLTKDLAEVLRGMSDKGVGMVAHIDANLPVRRGDCDVAQQREWDALESAIKGAGMMCVNREAWGTQGGMWSYRGSTKDGAEVTSWIDWVCVSRHMWEGGIVTGMWMMDEALAGSDHRGSYWTLTLWGCWGTLTFGKRRGWEVVGGCVESWMHMQRRMYMSGGTTWRGGAGKGSGGAEQGQLQGRQVWQFQRRANRDGLHQLTDP
jgi:hypothetical protein